MAIDNQFGKGIGVAAGFDLGAQKPLDARIAVNTIAERDAHVENNRAYEGMIVFVDETKKNYQLINGAWQELAKAEQDRLDALEAMLSGGEGVEGANGVLGALQDAIDDVNDRLEEGGDIENRIAQAESDIDGLQGLVGKPVEGETPATGLHLALDNAKKELDQAILTEKGRAEGQEAAIRKELADEKAALQSEIDTDVAAEAGLREAADTKIREDFAAADATLKAELQKEIDDDVKVEADRAAGEEAKIRQEFAAADAALHTTISKEIDDDVKVVSNALAALIEKVGHEGTNSDFDDPEPATGLVAKILANEAFVAAQPAIDQAQNKAITELEAFKEAMSDASEGLTDRVVALEDANKEGGAVANAIKDAQDAADAAQTDVDAIEKRLDDEGGLVDRIEANEANIARLDGAVDVEGSVKKQIKDAINAVNQAAGNLEDRVETLETFKTTTYPAAEQKVREDFAAADATNLQAAKDYADQQITALVDSAPEAMDTLNELAKAIKDNKDIYDGYIAEHATAMATMKSDLQKEIDDDVKVVADELTKQKDAEQEGTLAHKIAQEAARADAEEKAIKKLVADEKLTLQAEIDADIAAESKLRVAEEQRIEGLVTAEAERAAGKEGELAQAIATEKGRAEGKEGELLAAINKEITDRGAAVLAEQQRAEGQESAIRQELANEKAALQAEIDADVKVEKERAEGQEAAIRGEFAAADVALHTAIKAEMANIVSSLAVEFKDNKLVVGLGSGVDFVTLTEREVGMVTNADIDEIISGLDEEVGE